MKKALKGFTLIEILVVIGIIAILAGIVLVAINPSRQFAQANDTQRVSNVNAILNAIGQYIVDNKGTVPSEIPTTGSLSFNSTATGGTALCNKLVPTYIPALPFDPEGGNFLSCSSFDTKYTVASSTGRVKVSAVGQITADISVVR